MIMVVAVFLGPLGSYFPMSTGDVGESGKRNQMMPDVDTSLNSPAYRTKTGVSGLGAENSRKVPRSNGLTGALQAAPGLLENQA